MYVQGTCLSFLFLGNLLWHSWGGSKGPLGSAGMAAAASVATEATTTSLEGIPILLLNLVKGLLSFLSTLCLRPLLRKMLRKDRDNLLL